jgi:uncharacterized protein (UPF0297 family)
MKIRIQETPEQVELIKACASKDKLIAEEARAAVAELVGPVISEVINSAPTVSSLYQTLAFSEDDNLSIPLDLFHDVTDEDYIRIHSQSVAGGLSTNELYPAHDELKFKTYTLDSAISLDKKYLRKGRSIDISKVFTRMAQEFLLKQEKTSINQLLGALIAGDTKVNGTALAGNHIIDAVGKATSQLQLDDFNSLLTLSKRLWSSYSSGTPDGGAMVGVTDLLMSPEMVEELRNMAYNPVNTRSGAVTTSGATSIAATEEMRKQLMSQAGLPTFFGIGIIEVLEMGVNQRYNKIFDALNTAAGSPKTFTQGSHEILVGIDRSKESLIRPAVREEGVSTEVNVQVDDQFVSRQNKLGWYGKIEEGRIVIEDRVLTGIIV